MKYELITKVGNMKGWLGRVVCLAVSFMFVLLASCGSDEPSDPARPGNNPGIQPGVPVPQPSDIEILPLAKGVDISMFTAMEDAGQLFYNFAQHRDEERQPVECTALMKALGADAVRLRVYVSPKDGYCAKADVLEKARRAHRLGLDIMIDFCYSDSWTHAGQQPVPEEWTGHTLEELTSDVRQHTTEILSALEAEGIAPRWIQIGNETDNGMLHPAGNSDRDAAAYRQLFSAGSRAARAVFPKARIIVHISNAWDVQHVRDNLDMLSVSTYDIIGLSLYPSMAVGKTAYGHEAATSIRVSSEQEAVTLALRTVDALYNRYRKPCMMVEVGLPSDRETLSDALLAAIFREADANTTCQGVFYAEPEAYGQGYPWAAFADSGLPLSLMGGW